MKTTVVLLVLFVLFSPNIFAQEYTQWALPEEAKARFGKGEINEIQYSPDGTRLAVASSIGVWLYDTGTYQEVALLAGHTQAVRVAFSPDGNTIATGDGNGTVRLWDVVTGEEKPVLAGQAGTSNFVVFSPDGNTIASENGWDLQLWDAVTGENKWTYGQPVSSVAFSPDGNIIAAGVQLWNVVTGTPKQTLTGHTGGVESVAFSPDGNTFAAWSSREVWLWDTDTWKNKWTLTQEEGDVNYGRAINSVAFSPDGNTITTGSREKTERWSNGTVRLWDVVTGENKWTLKQEEEVHSVAFSPDGNIIASGSSNGEVKLLNAQTGKPKWTLTGHEGKVNSVAFSPDGNTLAAISKGNIVHLWDSKTGEHLYTITGTRWFSGVVFSPAGNLLATRSNRGIRLWDTGTWENKWTKWTHTGQPVNSVAFSPDGNTIAISSEGWIWLLDAKTEVHQRTLTGHTIQFSPDGNTLATVSSDNTVQLLDAVTRSRRGTLTVPESSLYSIVFSPDSTTLAIVSGYTRRLILRNATVRLWDTATGNKRTLTGHTADVRDVAFSPDGNTFAARSRREVWLWDTGTWRNKWTFKQEGTVSSMAFSPDSNTLAIGSGEIVHLLYTGTGEHLRTFIGHESSVNSVEFSPNGNTLATGSGDNTVRLWEVVTGEEKQVLIGHTDYITSIAFSPDGKLLASGSYDGTALLWKLTPSTATKSTVSIVPASVSSPAVGEQLTISLNIADGENVAAYQATIQFDSTALRYVKSANGDYLPAGAFFVPPVVKGNRVTLAATALAGVSNGDGTLATITFKIIVVKVSDLTLFQVNLTDPEGKRSFPQVENGQVIEPPQIEQIVGDVNRDGVVNILDMIHVSSNFGKTGQNDADVNGDGVVDIVDLVKVAGVINNAGAAPAAQPQVLSMLTTTNVQGWLTQAQRLNLTDLHSRRGIRFLEQLLDALTPKETALLQNYPNPFNPETWIPYHLADEADVQITIYDTKGVLVRQLDMGNQSAGYYANRAKAAYWDGRNETAESVASGIYFYTLMAGDYSVTRKMLILK